MQPSVLRTDYCCTATGASTLRVLRSGSARQRVTLGRPSQVVRISGLVALFRKHSIFLVKSGASRQIRMRSLRSVARSAILDCRGHSHDARHARLG